MLDISFVIAFGAGMVISFLITVLMHSGGKVDLDVLRKEALMFVGAAEKLLPGESGAEKLDYVMSMLTKFGTFKHLDEAVLRAAVEWAVSVWKRDQAEYLPFQLLEATDKYTEHGAVSDGSI